MVKLMRLLKFPFKLGIKGTILLFTFVFLLVSFICFIAIPVLSIIGILATIIYVLFVTTATYSWWVARNTAKLGYKVTEKGIEYGGKAVSKGLDVGEAGLELMDKASHKAVEGGKEVVSDSAKAVGQLTEKGVQLTSWSFFFFINHIKQQWKYYQYGRKHYWETN